MYFDISSYSYRAEREGRDDLLTRVNYLGWIWVDPETRQMLDPCPFLEQADEQRWICSINDTKPDICRDYAASIVTHLALNGRFFTQ